MENLNWKEGLNRIYYLLWGLGALLVTTVFLSQPSLEYFFIMVINISWPFFLKKAAIWIYTGFTQKSAP